MWWRVGKAGVSIGLQSILPGEWGREKNSRWCISEVGMLENKLMELERFQLIPSQHFEVSLLSYLIILLY